MLGYYKMPACLCQDFFPSFFNFYIFFFFLISFYGSYSRSFLILLSQKCFLVTSLISILTVFLVISFLDLNVLIFLWLLYAIYSYIKTNFLILRKNIQLISSKFFVNVLLLDFVNSYKFFLMLHRSAD